MPGLSFSPPDISDTEIEEVIDTLRSGWITTGPKTRRLEDEMTSFTGADGAVCLNSATAGMEMVLRLFDIGPGDEVITTPYTYSATAAVIIHTGATPIFADVKEGSFFIDPEDIKKKITPKTKAIIPVDVGGFPSDYDSIFKVIRENRDFTPKEGTLQAKLERILVLADAAHSIGARYKGRSIGCAADFTSFSFHAVKNVTTSEGGVVTWFNLPIESDEIYKGIKTLSLHGQNKDALSKSMAGSWEYDILYPGYKCNMTDIAASLGLIQLKRYRESLSNRREELFNLYINCFRDFERAILPYQREGESIGSYHLFQLRIKGLDEEKRNILISELAKRGVPANVHYKPLPMLTAYKKLGYRIEDYPNAYNQYQNQITLPLHTLLSDEDVEFICSSCKTVLNMLY